MGTKFQEERQWREMKARPRREFQKFQGYSNDPCPANAKFLRVGVPMTEEDLDLTAEDGRKSVLAMCQHNATHWFPVNEIKEHELDCPDGLSYSSMLKEFNQFTIVPQPVPRPQQQRNNRVYNNSNRGNNYRNNQHPNQ